MFARRFCLVVLSALTLCFTIQASAQATCRLSATNRTVTICTPSTGTTVSTTFHVNAGTTDSSSIQYIELYVANVRYVIQHTNYLDATVTVPAGSNQNLTVQAHDAGGVTFKATIHVNISAAAPYSISPANPTVSEGATQQFTGSSASTWSASCGSITSGGLFTAPLAQESCTVTGTATNGSGSASTSVKITSPITITPSSATTQVGKTQQFTANQAVTWSASCGSIDTNGLYTAPSSAETCTITATASSGSAYTATATDTATSSTGNALNYTTWKYDNSRDGLNSKETILTPTTVSNNFGQLFTAAVDGKIWTQPLYISNVTVGGVKHNLLFVGTANDSMYALDADTGKQVWKKSLLPSGETYATGDTIHSSVLPYVGVTGTPVIDPNTNTIYAAAESVTSGGTYYHRLHALDITTGAEKFGGPVTVTATGFDPKMQLQRPALLLANGNVYISYGSNDDHLPYHGWMFAYDAGSLAQVSVWNTTTEADAGAIWMGGAGPAADSNGNIYVSTANGDWDGSQQFGQSIVKLSPTLGILDYFTPINHVTETNNDKDLGSGGVTLLDSTGTNPHELINCSKLDVIYMLSRDHMGELGSSSDNVVQQVTGQLGGTTGIQVGDKCFTTAAYWNNNLYFGGNNDAIKQFSFSQSTGLMSTTPTHKDTHTLAFPGGQPVVSSNGNSNAIVWAIDFGTKTLRAYDATNVSNVLYVSSSLGTAVKWGVPTVINGKVYVGVNQKLFAFGLTSSGSSCTPPSSPGVNLCAPSAGGTYSSPVAVKAGGTPSNGTLNRMELWLDGKKVNNYYSNQINTTVTASSGSHYVTVQVIDSAGTVLKSAQTHFTVN
ncbi:MAG TPA: Ig-like domain-containing protein [Candidatus Koribacter sp.]|jgi:hypothetical protein